jgi:hypothetical protein
MRTFALAVAVLLSLQGCANHRLVVASGAAPDQRYHAVDSNAFGWNFSEQQTVAEQCPTNLLAEVRVRTSFLQSLGNVLTLGLWQPAHFEYVCAKAPTQAGTIEP